MSYKRLTIRDEFGNADIFGVDSELLYNELSFTEANALTKAFNRVAELEDKIENGTLIELPCIMQDHKKEYRVYFYNKTFKCIDCYRKKTKAEAEAKLKELQNER